MCVPVLNYSPPMSIREILAYVRSNQQKFSKEELWDQLRKLGYGEDEIEEAFVVIGQKNPPFSEFDKSTLKIGEEESLWSVMQKRAEARRTKPWLDTKEVINRGGIKKRGEFIVGFFLPIIVGLFGLLISTPRGVFMPPSIKTQLTVIGISSALSFGLYAWFKKKDFDFIRGVPYGVVALVAVGFAMMAIQYFSEFSQIFIK